MYNEEALKSNYKYNMLFNSISNSNNSDEDANFNTNIISDFDLQNFDPKRYEYYTNLLKVFNNDPETLYNVLNKYNSIKSLKVKEKKIIREINDYVNKLNDIKPAAQTGGIGDNADLLKIKKRSNKLLTEAEKLLRKSNELELNDTFINAIDTFIQEIGEFKNNLVTEDKHLEVNTRLTSAFDDAIIALSEAVETEAYRDDEEEQEAQAEQAEQAGGVSLISLLKEVPNAGPAGAAGADGADGAASAASAVKGTQANSKKKAQDREALISTAEKIVLTAKKMVEDTKIALKNIEEKNNEDIKRFRRAILGELNTDYKGKIEADTRAKAIKEKIKNVIKKDRGLIKSVDAFNDVVAETDHPIARYLSDYEFRDYDQSVDNVTADGTGVAGVVGLGVAGVGLATRTNSNTDTSHERGEVIDDVLKIVKKEVSNPNIPPTIEAEQSQTPPTQQPTQPPTSPTTSLMQPPTLEKRSSTLEDPLSQPMDASLAALAAPATIIAEGQAVVDTKLKDIAHNLQAAQAAPAAFAERGQKVAQAAIGEQIRNLGSLSGFAPIAASFVGGPVAGAVVNSLVTKGNTPPQLTRSQSVPRGVQLGGDDYNDDTLKARYLETRPQRYSKIINDEKTIKKFKDKQIENNRNIEIKTNNKIEQLTNDIDVYNALSFEEKKDSQKNKEIIQKIKNFENDPKNPLEELALTFDDRIVFIIATFFIRYVTIIMVQWCIDINIIKSFYEGFIYYAIIYIILFWFIVLFINIDNSFDVKYMNFNGIINSIRTLFYYFYMGTNGISRLLIHTSLILILIVIPIILNIKKKPTFNDDDAQDESMKILEYEERKQLSKSLSLFTMFIWLFTSIIATKF
jgi:hypothetical protein